MTSEAAVLAALARVRDPELDEPLTELGFVSGVSLAGDRVGVRLRLPTYYCAPNFAYLMVADARAAVLALDGVREVRVALEDHFSAEEINDAVDAGGGFADAFPGETSEGDLDELRSIFVRKAFVARQGRVCDRLARGGRSWAGLARMRVRDLPDGAETRRVVALREELGLAADPAARAFVRPNGEPLTAADLPRWLRVARLVRLSLEGNAGLCRSLLATRYGLPDPEEAIA